MVELNELVARYDPRFLEKKDLENGVRVKPLDFIVVTDWESQKLLAENLKSYRLREHMADGDARKYLDIEFVACMHGENGYGGSVFAAVPYTAEDCYRDLKDKLTYLYRMNGYQKRFEKVFEKEGEG